MNEHDRCPKCGNENIYFTSTDLLNPVRHFPAPVGWKPVWKWEWAMLCGDEDDYKISYCPFCGTKLPTHQEILLKELGY